MGSILVVVDMQNDFIDGSLGSEDAKAIVPKVVERIRKCNADKNETLIYTKDCHDEGYLETLEGKRLPIKHCIRNTDGYNLNKDVADAIAESFESTDWLDVWDEEADSRCCVKYTFGCEDFFGYIPLKKVDKITIIGLCTDICVISNAMILKAVNPNAQIVVDSSCCAGVSKEGHENALKAMQVCQIDII